MYNGLIPKILEEFEGRFMETAGVHSNFEKKFVQNKEPFTKKIIYF
jgi:hypothetical protein|tara:strand:- start:73 stop:210 length:138 start_codon:yes stop_codon:yes gene_type:complete